MKTKNIWGLFIILVIALFSSTFFSGCSSSKKMEKLSPQNVSEMINAKRFTFVAERVNPMRGRSRNLTSPYDVKVNEDTVNCYLPILAGLTRLPLIHPKVD